MIPYTIGEVEEFLKTALLDPYTRDLMEFLLERCKAGENLLRDVRAYLEEHVECTECTPTISAKVCSYINDD